MARQHQREIQFLQSLERTDPFIEKRISHVRNAGSFVHISGADNALSRQVNECVARRVAPAEKEELNIAGSFVKHQFRRISHVRRCRFDLLKLRTQRLPRLSVVLSVPPSLPHLRPRLVALAAKRSAPATGSPAMS